MRLLGDRGLISSILLAGVVLLTGQRVTLAAVEGIQFKPDAPAIIMIPGDVRLHWTATGDDGNSGRARAYDIRYSPISNGPINSEDRWNQAIQLTGEPTPSPCGRRDSMLVRGLTPGGRYYFSVKVSDEAGNCSQLSNSPLMLAAGGDFVPGDANNSGVVNGLDVVFMINYFKGGQPIPDPFLRADCNGNCMVDGVDVVFLLNYLHGSNNAPFRGNCAPIMAKPEVNVEY